jgi:hypothetical protein
MKESFDILPGRKCAKVREMGKGLVGGKLHRKQESPRQLVSYFLPTLGLPFCEERTFFFENVDPSFF